MEDRLEALEIENASLRKYNKHHQVVHEIDHMSDLHDFCNPNFAQTCQNPDVSKAMVNHRSIMHDVSLMTI